MYSALPRKIINRLADLAACKLLDGLLQGRVLLPDDFVKVRRPHPGFLKLLEWPPGLDSLVLASVAHEDYAVLFFQPAQEFVNFARAREAADPRTQGALPASPTQKAVPAAPAAFSMGGKSFSFPSRNSSRLN
jgi:hypothetical protein